MFLKKFKLALTVTIAGSGMLAIPAYAVENAKVSRVTAGEVDISWSSRKSVDVFVTDSPTTAVEKAQFISPADGDGVHRYAVPADVERPYFLLREKGSERVVIVAERLLPLEQGSNFRDLGGYKTVDGKAIRWGRIFRSGAMPMLSDRDYRTLGSLGIRAIIDLRSIDEREVAPTQLDDRTGALFLSNDYSLAPLMQNFSTKTDHFYAGMEKLLQPQLRQIFNRLLAAEGATLYNCSAGQDRTGISSALILSALGVDRATILADYHLSTPSRRLKWEMPDVKPADYPGNLIVQYYAASAAKPGERQAEPLYTAKGNSHLVEFFAYLDATYGGVDAYLARELNIGPNEIGKLRAVYLED